MAHKVSKVLSVALVLRVKLVTMAHKELKAESAQ
jgi:hypothetical protein